MEATIWGLGFREGPIVFLMIILYATAFILEHTLLITDTLLSDLLKACLENHRHILSSQGCVAKKAESPDISPHAQGQLFIRFLRPP